MRFVADMTEAASHGTPLTADTLRLFSSAAIPYGDIPARQFRNGAMVSRVCFLESEQESDA